MSIADTTVLILQARLDSTRLPRKALLPLCGEPLILRVMQALSYVNCRVKILACPPDSKDAFSSLCDYAGFEIFAGDKYNVLKRYCDALREFVPNVADAAGKLRVIRATGDNPFVFVDAAQLINDEAANRNADYAGYADLPYGAGVESVKAAALFAAEKVADETEAEHVCPYIYGRGAANFLLHRPPAPNLWRVPSLRITVDTPSDYNAAEKLYTAISDICGGANSSRDPHRYCGATVIQAAKNARLFPS